MKKFSLFLTVFGGCLWLVIATLHPHLPSPKNPFIFYSNQLRDDLKQVTLHALNGAKKSITLQIYGLTDPDVIHLLEKKQAEGVEVTIFYDPSASKTLPKTLPAFPIKAEGLMHRKILILDEEKVFIGTANMTTQSLKMHDNLILGIWDPDFAEFFTSSSFNEGEFEMEGAHFRAFLLPEASKKAEKALIEKIHNAEKEILVAMFTLTHPHLVKELLLALNRGVDVQIAIDRNTSLGASRKAITQLKEGGAKILTSTGSQLLHHKWALIDQKTLVLGSANWTLSAFSKNQDCLLLIDFVEDKRSKKLQRIWEAIAKGAEKG